FVSRRGNPLVLSLRKGEALVGGWVTLQRPFSADMTCRTALSRERRASGAGIFPNAARRLGTDVAAPRTRGLYQRPGRARGGILARVAVRRQGAQPGRCPVRLGQLPRVGGACVRAGQSPS